MEMTANTKVHILAGYSDCSLQPMFQTLASVRCYLIYWTATESSFKMVLI